MERVPAVRLGELVERLRIDLAPTAVAERAPDAAQ